MMRQWTVLWFVLLAASLFSVTANAERRVALVVGNGTYAGLPSLRNPDKDAIDMAETLQKLGFELVGGKAQINLARLPLLALLRDFAATVRSGDVALFYYAGHGLQVEGVNYMAPVDDRDIRYQEDVPDLAVSLDTLRRHFADRGAAPLIVILDACRDNPLPSRGRSASRGLARLEMGSGTYIAFATAPGASADDGSGRNGRFTAALLQALRKPERRIEDIFIDVVNMVERESGGKQSPWTSSNLRAPFWFSLTEPDSATPERPPRTRPQPQTGGNVIASLPPTPPGRSYLFVDDFNTHASRGNPYGVSFQGSGSEKRAVFKQKSESRIVYPFSEGFPREGTLEIDIRVDRGYSYSNFSLNEDNSCALIFTTDAQGGDVTWPGSAWLTVCKNGDVTFHIAGEKYEAGHKQKYKLQALGTDFRFGEWMRIGVSFGSGGRFIKVNGNIVASDRSQTQRLGGGGTHERSLGQPTIGEATSSFWKNNQHDGGFEGAVRRVWVATSQDGFEKN
ncbi:hypothetical protein J2847_004994 [Azospirillum agricola]|uniref:caspase family protein n=1 Tax=Azospirillum agricola TaxID=1720247 RepID=UPI001AE3CE48|nr:caspase family protein [Azospirillum agricola]MBP2231675.1 hypothetical protein [Azospirillum agricola]